ncbi:hypothetical protein DI005_00570 [Prauserella sp. PE36]|uniref:bifunctional DNA primase/polymerase n=1 Tax=Prauserella sp. PE36 TaxID=1504709 RepID=UPI000DE35638|nr:hypothetical protein DI005_00570 [Prauserella sp. PE36]
MIARPPQRAALSRSRKSDRVDREHGVSPPSSTKAGPAPGNRPSCVLWAQDLNLRPPSPWPPPSVGCTCTTPPSKAWSCATPAATPVDTRAWDGYVVAPGSITRTGAYRYVRDGAVAALPASLAERLDPTLPPDASHPNRAEHRPPLAVPGGRVAGGMPPGRRGQQQPQRHVVRRGRRARPAGPRGALPEDEVRAALRKRAGGTSARGSSPHARPTRP